jgi:hypothetical protein
LGPALAPATSTKFGEQSKELRSDAVLRRPHDKHCTVEADEAGVDGKALHREGDEAVAMEPDCRLGTLS